ncbi:hypothetical protein B0H21DRAFT_685482, partial [Amylocystis lapponica]
TPKKVDVHLPGPAPKTSKTKTAPSTPSARKKPASTAKRPPRSRASSVTSNVLEQPTEVMAPPPSSKKPVSKALKAQHLSRDTPDSVADDRSSVGDSSKASNRIRKTEAERMQFLQEDPHSGEVEPHRVFCTGCKEWVDLNPKRRFIMRLWLAHRKECTKGGPDEKYILPVIRRCMSDAGASKGTMLLLQKTQKRTKTMPLPSPRLSLPAANRRGLAQCMCLLVHTDAMVVLNFSRVATAQRKLQLVNDAQAKSFTTHTVECSLCGETVSLASSVDYDLAEWTKHKEICTRSRLARRLSAPALPETPSPGEPMQVDEPTSGDKSPPSAASTEATIIGTEAPTVRAGEKRQRDSEDDGGDKSKERLVRRRTLLYEVPEGDSPGVLDWMLLPFHTFVRGLREGMNR